MLCSTPMVAVKALVVVATLCVTATGFAAEPGHVASTAYRLSLERPAAFRLTATELFVSAPAPRTESASASRLADRPFAKLIDDAAREAALDPALVHAVISVESGYNPAARSPKGAIGLMQVLPGTASRYGVRDLARSPEANLRAGTRYLSDLMELFGGRTDLALAAYNAGENAVLRYGERIPPYRETQLYVPAVLARYREWRESQEQSPAVTPVRFQYLPGTRLDPKSVGTNQ